MARRKARKTQPSLEDALKALHAIQGGLDSVLQSAQELVPTLGEGLGGLLGNRLSILAEGGRAGLKAARHEVAAGAKILAHLVTEIGKLKGEPKKRGRKAAGRKARGGKRGPGRPKKVEAKAAAPAAKKVRKGRARKRTGQSLGDALMAVMAETKRSMMAAELASTLKERGYKSSAKNFRAVVQVTLSKDKRFKRDPKGGYRLA